MTSLTSDPSDTTLSPVASALVIHAPPALDSSSQIITGKRSEHN